MDQALLQNLSNDPYYDFRDEVEQSLEGARTFFEKWKELAKYPNKNKDELMWTTNELKSSARTIEGELQALGDTIDVVEKNRAKFRIDDSELMERKKFVSDTWAVINEIKQALNSNEFKAKQEHENRRDLGIKKKHQSKVARMEEEIRRDNDKFLDSEVQLQQEIKAEQDVNLDILQTTVGDIKNIALVLNSEIDSQKKELDELQEESVKTTSRLKSAMHKVDSLIEGTKDYKLWGIIVIMLIILIVLISFAVK